MMAGHAEAMLLHQAHVRAMLAWLFGDPTTWISGARGGPSRNETESAAQSAITPSRLSIAKDRCTVGGVAWATPQHTRGQVDAAGEYLAQLFKDPSSVEFEEFDRSFAILDNWRASHSYPLQALKMTLIGRARSVDERAVVAQRLKRVASVAGKLARYDGMKLSRMHDIGGCRAVVKSLKDVIRLQGIHEERAGRAGRAELVKPYDYISTPKADGYRSVHLVYKYRTRSEHLSVYNGLRIEVQLRSRLQHIWATAVEMASTFTGQALKSNIGDEDWKRFFVLMSSLLALKERAPLVPGTPTVRAELIAEAAGLADRLGVEASFEAWRTAIKHLPVQKKEGANLFLLELNATTRELSTTAYEKGQAAKANEDYAAAEKRTVSQPEIQVVLVSVDSVAALPRAYPNYYLDTRAFLAELRSSDVGEVT